MMIAAAVVCGFLLDLLFGDPAWMPHPVVIIGRWIAHLETVLRRVFPDTKNGELMGGAALVVCIVTGTLAVTLGICIAAFLIHPFLGFAVQTLWCWQALAAKGLKNESSNVYRCLKSGRPIEDARKAVGRIVGRDTKELSREGVIKAAVETVAENYSDGVLAPLLYLSIGGAPLGLTYKAINTMDSMVGYKNDKYLYFGRAAARLDDVAGYIPSRIAAVFFIVAAAFGGEGRTDRLPKGISVKNAWRIWRRDCRNHASPNSAQTESACAGALGIQLAGPAYYFGKLYEKPFIGESLRPIEADDILAANRLMYTASVLSIICFVGIRLMIMQWV